MHKSDLADLITKHGLQSLSKQINEAALPSIKILSSSEGGTKSTANGIPLLPEGFTWPRHVAGPYRFILQIAFSELNDESLPNKGHFALFAADTENQEYFWGDPGFLKGFYFSESTQLIPTENEEGILGEARPICFKPSISLPTRSDHQPNLPLHELSTNEALSYEQLVGEINDSDRLLYNEIGWLFGHPQFNTLAYNPIPGPEWISLFSLASDDNLEWFWHDGDWLMGFIEPSKLNPLDVSNLKADCG